MPNLKIFGAQVPDTALIFIATSTISSIFFYTNDQFIDGKESILCLLISVFVASIYWFKEYRVKK